MQIFFLVILTIEYVYPMSVYNQIYFCIYVKLVSVRFEICLVQK